MLLTYDQITRGVTGSPKIASLGSFGLMIKNLKYNIHADCRTFAYIVLR